MSKLTKEQLQESQEYITTLLEEEREPKLKVAVLGISVDSVKSHAKFVKKYNLPFTLLADEDKNIVKKYGVWQKKQFMGKEYMGTLRTSFLIDPSGKIAKIYENVKPEIHAEEVLKDLNKKEQGNNKINLFIPFFVIKT